MTSRIITKLLVIVFSGLLVFCSEEQLPEPAPVEEKEEVVTPPVADIDTVDTPQAPVPVDTLSETDSLSNVDTTSTPIEPPTFNDQYEYGSFEDMPYRILLPRNYSESKQYPLLLFLHGRGERGSDNEKQLTFGASLFQEDSIREKYPAIIVFPQCPSDVYWFDNWALNKLEQLITNLTQNYSVDQSKLLIGGLSMGAYGTFEVVSRNPEMFVRAVAIAGDGDHNQAGRMKKPKWRIFAGEKDQVVPSKKTKGIARALEKAGASVSLTVYPDADHLDSWMNAFAEPDFCQWLFKD